MSDEVRIMRMRVRMTYHTVKVDLFIERDHSATLRNACQK